MKKLGARISSLRHAGETGEVSLSALAEKAGVAKSYLAKIERGEVDNPGLATLTSIARALGVTVADLVEGARPMRVAEGEARLSRLADLTAMRQSMSPSLKFFIEQKEMTGHPVPLELQRALALVEFRGRRPERPEDWSFLYEALLRAIR